MEEFKMDQLHEDLLLNLHTRFPNTIDDDAKLLVGKLGFEKGKAHGCIYSGKASITNEKKGIELNFSIWFSIYCEAYEAPKVKPDIRSYLTGEYLKIQKTSEDIPVLRLESIVLLNMPETKMFEDDPRKKRYFDAYWHTFYTDKGNVILSREGWFGFYVYDKVLGIRPTTDDDWINIGDGRREIKEGLELVKESNDVKEFMVKIYNERVAPGMYVEL